MAIHGSEIWGLNFVVAIVAAYVIVLAVALTVVGVRRLVGQLGAGDGAPAPRRDLRTGADSAAR